MKSLNHRHELGAWLNQNNLLGQGVEVGCMSGDHARVILESWKGAHLTMVDPWATQPSGEYREITNTSTNFVEAFSHCLTLADSHPGRVTLMRALSVDAAPEFADRSLDFVYIDGNHRYEAVLEDLAAWARKVKKGGLLGGHDFLNDTSTPGWDCEVKRAVSEWCADEGKIPHLTSCSSWWILR